PAAGPGRRLQFDQEATPTHAQLVDQGGGGGGQRLAGGAAGGGERRGGLGPAFRSAGDLGVQLQQAVAGAAQRLQFGGDGIAVRGQFRGRQAVLARQVVDPAQAAFQFLEAVRVQVQVVADPAEQGKRFLELDGGAL